MIVDEAESCTYRDRVLGGVSDFYNLGAFKKTIIPLALVGC